MPYLSAGLPPTLMLPELAATVRRTAQSMKGKPMAMELARRDIIRRDVLELHGR